MFASDPYGAIQSESFYEQNIQTLNLAGFSETDKNIVLSNTFLRFMNTDVLASMRVGTPSLIWWHLRGEAQKASSLNEPKFTPFAAKIIAYAYLPHFTSYNNQFEQDDNSKIQSVVALSRIKRGVLHLSKVPEKSHTYTFVL